MGNYMDDQSKLKGLIYTPAQSATYTMESVRKTAQDAKSGIGVALPIKGIGLGDRPYFPPVLAGQACAVIAQTSNYKSGLFHFIERAAADDLLLRQMYDNIIVHVSVEEPVEEQMMQMLARESGERVGDMARGVIQDWNLLEAAAVRVGTIPIYRIGDSLARAEDMPHLYISNMIEAIRILVSGDVLDYKPKVAGIFFDYLQAFPMDPQFRAMEPDAQRRLQVRHDVYEIRRAAHLFNCPVFVAIQAKQKLEGANPPLMLPGVYDGEETSSIAQRMDRVITMWMPKMTHPVGKTIESGSLVFTVTEDLLMLKVAKQRGRLPSGKFWQCSINFQDNTVRVLY